MAKKAKKRKPATGKTSSRMVLESASTPHPDKRYPVRNDPDHEILCKWIDDATGYECKQVATGEDWGT